jgi:peptidoglycan/xylan/chitin deacetylase (PgdA/CDA1 family)
MLLILMYHRVHRVGRVPNALATHFRYLRDHHPMVLPGDPLEAGRINVCLTFDDATVDFRHQVYPLLETLDARALVAVPTAYVEQDTAIPLATRLAAQQTGAMARGYTVTGSPLCTWRELSEMQASGRVLCASHGHSHADLSVPDVDLEREVQLSAAALEEHLGVLPNTFVYPYGRTSRAARVQVGRRFRYSMRIGAAINLGWAPLLYRVDAERFWPDGRVWSLTDALRWRLNYLGNRLRGK